MNTDKLQLPEASECWFKMCTQQTINDAVDMRQRGYPVTAIAEKIGFHYSTMARYLRAYDRYGDSVFAADVSNSDEKGNNSNA